MKPNAGVAQFTAAISRHRGVDVAVRCLAQRPSERLEFVKQLAHELARGLVGQPTLSVEFLVCSVYQHFWLEHGICIRIRQRLPELRLGTSGSHTPGRCPHDCR